MKKVIIFDVDGTLYDTKKGIVYAFNRVLDDMQKGRLLQEDEDRIIGPAVRNSFINIVALNEADADKATALYRKHYIEEYIKLSQIYSGTENVLKELKNRGYTLGIATMKTRPQIERLLESTIGFEYFSVVETAYEDGSLSKAQMLEKIKEEFGEAEYYMVGDTEGDYQACVLAHMKFIYATYGYGEVTPNQNIYRLKEISDILNLFV